ncbi:MAG TPA: hypothetical protein VNW15_09830 [Rhizomicrobium sp.]|nr:hypothetical protein [Rhizomicrobium sp.]
MTRLGFDPQVPLALIGALAIVAILLTAYGFYVGARGAWARGLAFAILIFALCGPILVRENHAPLPDVVAVIMDRSQSMNIGERIAQSEKALAQIRKSLAAQPDLTVRQADVTTTTNGENNGTQAFAALNEALADVPPARVAGAIMITDGEVHDAPAPAQMNLKAPLQVLIAGQRGERDRKLSVVNAARFAIVGQAAQMVVRVDDFGAGGDALADVVISVDGHALGTRSLPVGKDTAIAIPVTHEGENIVEIAAQPGPSELTLQNNRAVVTVSGVRDRLRVLLVSGEPHAGERVWRNLLKADPSVDLIHFTILRPPEKQDGTPINELSLIAFPTPELFRADKLKAFDLVIFDRYGEQGILPMIYFENLAQYVEQGGALLLSSGPEFAGPTSIYRTPLSSVLPAQPTGEIITQAFKPVVTPLGLAHPVTRDLPESNSDNVAPSWGRWFRMIGAVPVAGQTIMSGPGGKPLLVLDQVQKGRVAELLSDQIWLWARGFEGGGPQAELLRRLAHWLMKEPELEAENLSALAADGEIVVTRRTMSQTTPPVTMTMPSGKTMTLTLEKAAPGVWRAAAKVNELGLYRVSDGTLSAVAAAGPLNPKEVADMRATEEILRTDAEAHGGGVHWLADGVPQIRRVVPGQDASGADWIGLRRNGAYRVTSLSQEPLLPAWAALVLIVGSLLLAWRIEGR